MPGVKTSITGENPNQPEIRKLLAASDAYMAALYPAESNHAPDLQELLQPNVRFAVARINGVAIGCAAMVLRTDHCAELKRMFVDGKARGSGLGKELMRWLEREAKQLNVKHLRLETGIHQPEAIALYKAFGFKNRGPFPPYKEDPLSIFMEKSL